MRTGLYDRTSHTFSAISRAFVSAAPRWLTAKSALRKALPSVEAIRVTSYGDCCTARDPATFKVMSATMSSACLRLMASREGLLGLIRRSEQRRSTWHASFSDVRSALSLAAVQLQPGVLHPAGPLPSTPWPLSQCAIMNYVRDEQEDGEGSPHLLKHCIVGTKRSLTLVSSRERAAVPRARFCGGMTGGRRSCTTSLKTVKNCLSTEKVTQEPPRQEVPLAPAHTQELASQRGSEVPEPHSNERSTNVDHRSESLVVREEKEVVVGGCWPCLVNVQTAAGLKLQTTKPHPGKSHCNGHEALSSAVKLASVQLGGAHPHPQLQRQEPEGAD